MLGGGVLASPCLRHEALFSFGDLQTFDFLFWMIFSVSACKLAKAFLVPLIFWDDSHGADHLFDFKLGIFQEDFALSLDTEAFYPCLQVTSYKPLLEVSRCSLNSFCEVSSFLCSCFTPFGHFLFPFPLGSRGIPELRLLLLEAESYSEHCLHDFKIFMLFQRR